MSRLTNKVAIVTGADSGIGRAIALQFAHEGATIVINYHRQADKAQEVIDAITKDGGQGQVVQADVSLAADVDRLIQAAVAHFGHLDIFVNNSGIEEQQPFVDTPLDVWSRVIAVDLTGPWLGSQAAARQFIAQGQGGRILNISSVHEDLPMPNNAPYCAAKGGLRMLMRTIAVELAPHQITVNNIAPGAIATPINAETEQDPQKMQALLAEIPLGRIGQPEDVAELATYLASDAAGYVTGSTFVIDGGLMQHSGSL